MRKALKSPRRSSATEPSPKMPEAGPPSTAQSLTPLGERIHRMRQERRWSLSELSKRSSIATSTLSKVENGLLSLPYDRLQLVANAFQMSLSEFFSSESSSGNAALARISWARRGTGEVVDSGAYVYHYLCNSVRVKRMVPILSEVKARSLAEFGRLLKHEGEEFVFAYRGRIEVHTEYYQAEILEEGEGVYLDSRMGHAYTNAGSGDAWILSVNTNPLDSEAIVRKDTERETRAAPGAEKRRLRKPA